MSVRDPQAVAHRQLHDIRILARDAEAELTILLQEQRQLDAYIAAATRQRCWSRRQRFARGVALGVMAMSATWFLAFFLTHFAARL